MSELEIRIAGQPELETLGMLVCAFRDQLGASGPSEDELRTRLPETLADPAVEFACAWLEGRPVGYTQLRVFPSIWSPGREAYLEDLFVVASARRRQVGRALLQHALERASESGAGMLTLVTNERNEPAQRLYRSAGLRPDSEPTWGDGREVRWVIGLDREGLC